VKRRQRRLGNERGQTTLEYMLLLATTFIVSYLVITGPMGTFTRLMLATIRSALINVVQNAELTPGTVLQPGQSGHPGNPIRTKALHL
jgi:hypothetical protein